MNKQRNLPGKDKRQNSENRSFDWFDPRFCFDVIEANCVKRGSIIIMLVDFSYNPQIHDWGWISFHLKEEMHGIFFF